MCGHFRFFFFFKGGSDEPWPCRGCCFFLGGNPNDLNISSERFLIQASLGPEPRLVGGLNPLA